MSKDVELTNEEKRILADIERNEGDLRAEVPWSRLQAPIGSRRDFGAWFTTGAGITILVAGLIANVGVVPFVGFVILLIGATRLSTRLSSRRWWQRGWGAVRSVRSGPRSGDDGT